MHLIIPHISLSIYLSPLNLTFIIMNAFFLSISTSSQPLPSSSILVPSSIFMLRSVRPHQVTDEQSRWSLYSQPFTLNIIPVRSLHTCKSVWRRSTNTHTHIWKSSTGENLIKSIKVERDEEAGRWMDSAEYSHVLHLTLLLIHHRASVTFSSWLFAPV